MLLANLATSRVVDDPDAWTWVGGPAFPRVEEPVLAGFSLPPTGAFDESDHPGVRTSVIGLPRKE